MAGEYEDAATNELQVGLLLKAGKEERAVRLRITHAFNSSIYVVREMLINERRRRV